jgi:rare lipoprotein A
MPIAKITYSLIMVLSICFISACSNGYGRYQQKHDSTPERLPNSSELHDATPRAETHSRGGNKHYQVRGKHYQVLKSAENFSATGIASWYGRKFHGHLTSNGEIYDMYAMSAAHKNLPLPTYLKVVNNDNGLSVIVRVNDRGPFHESRIIDLSYSAAYKLDMLKTGTANVTITAITDFSANGIATRQNNKSNVNTTYSKIKSLPKNTVPTTTISNTQISEVLIAEAATPTLVKTAMPATAAETITNQQALPNTPLSTAQSITVVTSGEFIQVFASKSSIQAEKLANALSSLHQQNTQLEQINGIFRVLVGPIKQGDEITRLLLSIKNNGYPNAFIRQLN